MGTNPRGRQDPGEPYRRISIADAKEMLDENPESTIIVDVRQPNEWIEGHVAGAVHIVVDTLLSRIDELPKGKDLLFICAAGVRSGLAAEMAAAMGFQSDRLYNIEDGTPKWIEADYPTNYGDQP